MKIKGQLFLVLMLVVFFSSSAQKAAYWVVETNVNQKNFTVVRFYDRGNSFLDEIKLRGIYLDVSRPKHRRKLNDLLYAYNWKDLMSSRKSKSRKTLLQ